jgi:hypothetical protein
MKGRHVVILVFVFGLSLMAILFRLLPQAKPGGPPPIPAPPPFDAPRPLPPPVLDPENSGKIEVFVTSKGAPVVGATVSLQNGQRNIQATSGAGGRCLVPAAEAGEWQIVARAAGAAATFVRRTVEVGRTVRVELELAAGARLEGFVRDGAGNPVALARVALSLPDPAYATRSDAVGHYVIADVPLGTHAVRASSERLRPQTRNVDLSTAGQTYPQDFQLDFGTMLAGSVVDEAGTPVSRATVTVTNEVARVVRTDGNGDFRVDGLGEGLITVSVLARGFAPASRRAVAPNSTGVKVTLGRGATLMGHIDGAPVAFSLHLSRFDPALGRMDLYQSYSFGKNTNGTFHVVDLPAGQFEVVIEAGDRRTPAPLPLVLEAGMTKDMQLVVLAAK